MHILSKICLGLVILLWIPGLMFTVQLANKRNAITEKVVAEKKKRDANIDEIAKLRITRQLEVDELSRLQADWGRQWTAQGEADPAQLSVLINVGQQQGLGIQLPNRPPEPVYLFAVQQDGTSLYLGEFSVTGPSPQRTVMTLNRKPFGDELAAWPQTGQFRVRERIPAGVRAMFHDLSTNQAIADQIVINETAKLRIQDNHIAASQATLDRRLAELNGDPASPPTADREIVSGLVDTIRVEEAERNAVLKDVDSLRRELSNRYARLRQVLAENKQAIDAMAAGTETAAAAPPGAN